MERIRTYLCSIEVPSYAELKSGDYFRSFLVTKQKTDASFIKDIENSLICLQEVLLWTNVQQSVCWLVISQMFLYQFCLAATPVISSTAYLCLLTYLYSTWTQRIWPTIRVPPQHTEDEEKWTPVHPDILSAPELESIISRIKKRFTEIYCGLWLLRSESPLRFSVTMSVVFSSLALLGTKVSTPLLVHSVALAVFILPPLLVALAKNPSIEPVLVLVGDVLCSLSNLAVYRGNSAPPQECHELDEFIPEQSKETQESLESAVNLPTLDKEPEDSLSLTLARDLSIPSHEEVDLLALTQGDLEADLLPCSRIEDDGVSSSSSDIEGPVGRIGGVEDTDSDSADPQFSLTSATSPLSYLPSLPTSVASVLQAELLDQVLGSLVNPQPSLVNPPSRREQRRDRRRESEPDLEDFELISEDELDRESP